VHQQDTRFWRKVNTAETCWLWTGARNQDGYGNLTRDNRSERAHRYAWMLVTGETLTSRDTICHTCDVPNCVRVDDEGTYQVGRNVYPRRGHLYKATQPANIADRDGKERGQWAKGKRHGTHTMPERLARGERSGNAKLTDAEVCEILSLANGKFGNKAALARRFKVSIPLITWILEGKGWTHINRVAIERRPEDGPLRDSWTAHPTGCTVCGSKESRHSARGVCRRCYMRERMRLKRAEGYIAPCRRK
jgi:hypothetical protein